MNEFTYSQKTAQIKSIAKKALEEKIISQEVYADLSSRIQDNEFRITIVGEFSSGKSTLIDALIGKDILPHSTSETTATLTYIHSVECGSPKVNTAEIFYSDGKTKVVDFSILKEYVTAFSKTIDVFTSIEYVDIYVHLDNFDNNIVIVDTPGLNGTNHYEDRTLREIAKADASIFVFSPSGIKATEQSFMKEELSKYQKSFFFVMNRIDDLHTTEGDSVEDKLQELAKDISERFFDGKEKITNLYGVSALKALVAKDRKIEKLYADDQNFISDTDRERFWQESRFDYFLTNLKKYLADEKEKVFINSLVAQLSLRFEECLRSIDQNLIAYSPKKELPAEAIIKDEIDTAKARFDSYDKGLQKNVNARMDTVEMNLQKRLSEVIASGKLRYEEVKRQIDSIKTIEEFYRIFGEDGSKASGIIDSFYDRHFENVKKYLKNDILTVRDEMLQEIRSLIPDIGDFKQSSIDSVNIGSKTYTYVSKDNNSIAQARVKECSERIAELQRKQNEAYKEKATVDKQHNILSNEASRLQSNINSIRYSISNLGRRPDSVIVRGTHEVKAERSIWNPKRWFGSKYYTKEESYEYEDKSAQREYDRKRKNLEDERAEKNSQLAKIRRQIDNLPDVEETLQKIARDIERQIKEKEFQLSEIRKNEEARQKEMAAGRLAFLNSRKNELINTLRNILSDEKSDLHLALKNDSKKYLAELRGNLTAVIHSYFMSESDNYIKQLKVMLANISSSLEDKDIENKRKDLNVSKNKVITLLKEIKNLVI